MTKRKSTTKPTTRKTSARSKSTRGGTGRKKRTTPRKSTTKRKPRARKTTTRRKKQEPQLSFAQKMLITGMVIVFLTILLVLSLLSPNQGAFTEGLFLLLMRGFGWGGYVIPIVTGAVGFYLLLRGMDQQPQLPGWRLTGLGLLYVTFEGFASLTLLLLNNPYTDPWSIARAQTGGGYFGGLIIYPLVNAFGDYGAIFTLLVLGIISAILVSGVSREALGEFLVNLFDRDRLPANPLAGRDIAINTPATRRARRRGTEDEPEGPIQPPLLPPEPTESAAEPEPEPEPEPKPQPRRRSRRKKEEPQEEPTVASPVFLGAQNAPAGNWQLPPLAAMLEPGSDADPSGVVIREQVETIESTLESFGAPAKVVEINQGPTITQFGVEPSFIEQRSGKRTKVKVGKIAGLADDLTLALHARSIRIQAPVPGKGYVGIEVPNPDKAVVSLRDVMESTAFQKLKSPLRIGLGQDVAGQPIVADLTKMPHLLIAGATGSGKSVCVNSIIASLILLNTPDQLKLVMVDPKRVELTGYNGIPHLAAPVVVEMDRVIGVLQWAMREMDNRYRMFADIGARNITDFNKKAKRNKKVDPIPYIVIIVDELADLMMLSPEETERGITRLAQLARATGMHLVIATQRPSVDVVTGLIKANFPARVAFAVASSTDSRVILDSNGAERLLGQGDMLYQAPDAAAPVRSQGCFVSDLELTRLIDYWRSASRFNIIPAEESIAPRPETPAALADNVAPAAPPINNQPAATAPVGETPPEEEAEPTVSSHTDAPTTPVAPQPRQIPDAPPAEAPPVTTQQPLWEALQEEPQEPQYEDELMADAIALVRKLNKASTSMLQRRFRIGYTRAARMIDAMEEMGIIGPPTGTSKARDVLPWEDPEKRFEPDTGDSSDEDEDPTTLSTTSEI